MFNSLQKLTFKMKPFLRYVYWSKKWTSIWLPYSCIMVFTQYSCKYNARKHIIMVPCPKTWWYHGTFVLLCYFNLFIRFSFRKIWPNIVFRVKKVTCKPLDKGQKSTRCTSLRKLLGIFTESLMMRNTNTDSSSNAPSLSHLVSSITDDTPAVFSSTSKSKNTHLLLFYRRVLSFQDAIGRAMEKHPMLVVLNSRTRARTRIHLHALHPETRELQASKMPKMLWNPTLTFAGYLDRCLVLQKISANRVDETVREWESLTISWRFGLCATPQSVLKGKRPLIYTTDRKQTILSL